MVSCFLCLVILDYVMLIVLKILLALIIWGLAWRHLSLEKICICFCKVPGDTPCSVFSLIKYKALIFWTIKQCEFTLYEGRMISNSTLSPKSKTLWGSSLIVECSLLLSPFWFGSRLWFLSSSTCQIIKTKGQKKIFIGQFPKVKATLMFHLSLFVPYFPLCWPDNSVTSWH